MKLLTRACWSGTLVLGVCLILAVAPAASAQKVAISFDDYHGYTGTIEYIRQVANSYPEITNLIEIGRSTMDRPIYVLVISNMSTGTTIDKHVPLRNMRKENVQNVTPMKPYHGKPGHWVDGGTHGNEYTGTEVCLYIIDKLVSGYGSETEITDLIDDNAFFICPIVNPDGVFNSAEGGISQRQNSMKEDNDKDGTINEDGPDDLNGDGFLTQFRYKDPEGRYVIDDRDSRVMRRLGRDEETDADRYTVVSEDKDNDGDGRRGEDPERGIDLNRNYPEGWFRDDNSGGGTGFYPSSAPETHAILEFFTNNTSILMVQSYHTSGGFTYRPFARWPDTRIHAKDLAIYDRIMGVKYLELIGEEIPEAWKTTSISGGLADQGPARQRRRPQEPGNRVQAPGGRGQAAPEQPRGWRHPYNDRQNRPYGYGIFMDWAYGQFGAYSMSTELWNWRKDTKGLPGFSGEDDRSLWELSYIKHQEEAFDGKRFIAWQPFNHPELGEGEIGGWVARYRSSNAIPGDSLRGVCDTHWQFELFKAKLLPKIEITEAEATVLYTTDNADGAAVEQDGDTFTIKRGDGSGSANGKYKVIKVKATIKNTGSLPTHVARGPSLAGNREDAVWLLGDRDKVKYLHGSAWMSMGTLDGAMEIPGYQAVAEGAQVQPMQMQMGRGQRGRGPTMPGTPLQRMRMSVQQGPQIKKTGTTREITWLVAVEGDTPLKVIVTSQKGGTAVKELSIN